MKVLLICNYPFPKGLAATNRIVAISQGLAQNFVQLDVLTFCPENIDFNYENASRTVFSVCNFSSKTSVFRRVLIDLSFRRIRGILFACKLLKRNKYTSVLISNEDFWLIFFLLPVVRLFKRNIGFISDEYPQSIRMLRNRLTIPEILKHQILNFFIKFRIVISEDLKSYYNRHFGVKQTLVLSGIVNENILKDEFNAFGHKANRLPHKIVYVGNLELSKDNIDNIIHAVGHLNKNVFPIEFFIYGNPNERDRVFLEELITNLELNSMVFLMGYIEYLDVKAVLESATLLVSSQPNSLRAKGGFPTKLGEYWSSGIPVLFTDVGEIGMFVKDGENGFLVPPDNFLEYCKKLEFILSNLEYAKKVGVNGKNYLKEFFLPKKATEELANLLKGF